ncbi:MAG: BspA family leucine-rich repeat surface protein [Erysipelotrichaceae bacterium]|nr:BspA family leucine-rich repeat surface protein [Erysipelotrichaceae bacterium]
MKKLIKICLSLLMSISTVFSTGYTHFLVQADDQDPAETIETYCSWINHISSEDETDNDALFEQYISKRFEENLPSIHYEIKPGRDTERTKVTFDEPNRILYEFLEGSIISTANGETVSTVYSIPVEEFGTCTVNASALGFSTFTENGKLTEIAAQEISKWFYSRLDIDKIIDVLLLDHPYEMYWYDKTAGLKYGGFAISTENNGRSATVVGDLTFSFSVASEYAAGQYEIDPSYGTMVTTAIDNANRIVGEHQEESDYEKIKAYRDEICELVEYNYAALGDEVSYGNPWQLIWVFDGDPDTNVVCEGYSKAFQYLCDASWFANSNINAYCVTGEMKGGTGAGRHMWNIVTMDDGKNYLVDVTNCDGNSVGADYELFLIGVDENDNTSSPSSGYTFKPNGSAITYTYDEDLYSVYSTDELTIAKGNYQAPEAAEPDSGIAYAILMDNGNLIFFRSNEEYEDGVYTTVTDIHGNTYEGTVYADVENGAHGWNADASMLPDESDANYDVKNVYVANNTVIRPTSMQMWFNKCLALETFNGRGFDGSQLENTAAMFNRCRQLTGINTLFSTENVTNMMGMFCNCTNLVEFDTSLLDTSSATDISEMFEGCESLTTLDVSNFNTAKVTDMTAIFKDCGNITRLDLTGFDTSNIDYAQYESEEDYVSKMYGMFDGCDRLLEVTLGTGFTTWYGDAKLPEGVWSNGDISKSQTELYQQYPANASSWAGTWTRTLPFHPHMSDIELVLTPGDTYQLKVIYEPEDYPVISTNWMLGSGDSNVVTVDQNGWVTALNEGTVNVLCEVTDRNGGYFTHCEVTVSTNLRPYAVLTDEKDLIFVNSYGRYRNDRGVIQDPNFVKYYGVVFEDVNDSFSGYEIDHVFVAPNNTVKVDDWYAKFSGTGITWFESAGFDTSDATDMSSVFYNCDQLVTADLSGFNTEKVTTFSGMFAGCSSLQFADLSTWNTPVLQSVNSMFENCSSMTGVVLGEGFTTDNVAFFNSMFAGCSFITHLDLSSFNTAQATQMKNMFNGCGLLVSLDISLFDTQNVTDMENMFANCPILSTVDLGAGFGNNWTSNAYLPEGNWTNREAEETLTETELYNRDNSVLAGTWERKEAKPKLSEGSLTLAENESFDLDLILPEYYPAVTAEWFTTDENVVTVDQEGVVTAVAPGTANVSCMIRWENNSVSSVGCVVTVTGGGQVEDLVYAVLTDEGELIFLKSKNVYPSDERRTVTDINNNQYTGMVFADAAKIENFYLWNNHRDEIKSIRVADNTTIEFNSLAYAFSGLNELVAFNSTGFDTSSVNNMQYAFYYCDKLETLDLSGFDTSNVTNMEGMFECCLNLKDLDISLFNTESAVSFERMFCDCASLETIDIKHFQSDSLESINFMFEACINLRSVDISGLGINENYPVYSLFYNCYALESVTLGPDLKGSSMDFGLPAGTWTNGSLSKDTYELNEEYKYNSEEWAGTWTRQLTQIQSLDIRPIAPVKVGSSQFIDWDITPNENVNRKLTFTTSDPEIATVDVFGNVHGVSVGTAIITGTTTDGSEISSSEEVIVVDAEAFAVLQDNGDLVLIRSDFSGDWYEADEITDINGNTYEGKRYGHLENLNSGIVGDDDLSLVKKVYVADKTTIYPTGMGQWFMDMINLEEVDLTGIDSHNAEEFNSLFRNCKSLKKINMGTLNTVKATRMYDLFYNCDNLTEIVLSPNMTVWQEYALLPEGNWTNAELDITRTAIELYNQYPAHAAEWAGTWTRPEPIKAVLSESSIELAEGGSYRLSASVTPEGTEIVNESWRTGNEIVAAVDQTGFVTGIKAGITTVTYEATLADGTSVSAECEVVVRTYAPTDSTAYAVLTEETLIFFRSTEVYNNGEYYETITDINGNTYSGTVFTDVEIGRHNWDIYLIRNVYVAPDTTIAPATMAGWFRGLIELESFDGTGFDTSNTTDMQMMFFSCSKLNSINVSNFDVGYVGSMEGMFAYCHALSDLSLDGWNPSRVTNMSRMFEGSRELTELSFEGWDTSNVTNMSDMFSGCYKLQTLDISSFNTENVINMSGMFDNCFKLEHVTLGSSFTKWIDNAYLYWGEWTHDDITLNESGLYAQYPEHASEWAGEWTREIPPTVNFNTNYVELHVGETYQLIPTVSPEDTVFLSTDWYSQNAVVASIDDNGVITALRPGVTSITFSGFYKENNASAVDCEVVVLPDTTPETTAYAVLTDLGDLVFLRSNNVYENGTRNTVVDINNQEYIGTVYTDVEIGKHYWDSWEYGYPENVMRAYVAEENTIAPTSMWMWFCHCPNLESFDGTGFDSSNITDLSYLFVNCENLTYVNMEDFTAPYVGQLYYMFNGCTSLENISLPNLSTEHVLRTDYMFAGCSSLKTLNIASLNTENLPGMLDMFYGCNNLETVVLGEGFTYWANEAYLPEGYWTNGSVTLTAEALYAQYPEHAAEWAGTWTKTEISAESIELNTESLELTTAQNQQLIATVLPEGAPADLRWSSSDENIATVDGNGIVYPVSPGTVTITVSSGNVSASCQVTITKAEYQRDEDAEYSTVTYFFTFNFKRENYSHTVHETETEKVNTQNALNNKYFRLAVQAALDKYEYNGNTNVRNIINQYEFDKLSTGEVYGDLVKNKYVEYMSEYNDGSIDLTDGSNDMYDPDLVTAYIAKAESEGIQFPIKLDVVGIASRAQGVLKLKNMIESASNGKISLNVTLFNDIREYNEAFYYSDRIEDNDCDMIIGSGWAPDKDSPADMMRGVLTQTIFKGSVENYTELMSELGIDVWNEMIAEAENCEYGDELLSKAALAEAYALSNCYVIPYSTSRITEDSHGVNYPRMLMHPGDTRHLEVYGDIDTDKGVTWELVASSLKPTDPRTAEASSEYATIDENGNLTAIKEGSVAVRVTYYMPNIDTPVDKTRYVAIVPEDITISEGDYSKVYSQGFYMLNDDAYDEYMQLINVTDDWESVDAHMLYRFATEGMPDGVRGNRDFIVEDYKSEHPELVNVYGDDTPAYYASYIDGNTSSKTCVITTQVVDDWGAPLSDPCISLTGDGVYEVGATVTITVIPDEGKHVMIGFGFGFPGDIVYIDVEGDYGIISERSEYTFVVPDKETLSVYVRYMDGMDVTISTNMSDIVSFQSPIRAEYGEKITLRFEMADGYQLDPDKPFKPVEYRGIFTEDGSDLYYYTDESSIPQINKDVADVTTINQISWYVGIGILKIEPNIIFVGHDTTEEQELGDLVVVTEEDNSDPGVVIYNPTEETKTYNVTLSSLDETGGVDGNSIVNPFRATISAVIRPVEGDNGLKNVTLITTTGNINNPGQVVTEQNDYANLSSLEITVGPDEFVTYAVKPQEGQTLDEYKFEVVDADSNEEVSKGYVSQDDPAKHLVISDYVYVTSVNLDSESLDLMMGETAQLTVTVNPENADNKAVTWTSSDESVATVDEEGNVKAVGEGTAVITVTSENGKTATCEVTVQRGECIEHSWKYVDFTVNEELTGVEFNYVCEVCGERRSVAGELYEDSGSPVIDATCTEDGLRLFHAFIGKSAALDGVNMDLPYEVTVPALGHDWNEPTYDWADDYSTITATRTCKHGDHPETETVKPLVQVIKRPTCIEKGETKYTAHFTNEVFETQTITVETAALGHAWKYVDYTINDDYTEVLYNYVCETDSSHKQSVKGEITVSNRIEPTCTEAGSFNVSIFIGKTAALDGINRAEGMVIELPALGHDWNEPTYTWSADKSTVTATRTCKNGDHPETETVNTTKQVIDPTCKEDGQIIYTAEFTNPAFKTQTKTEKGEISTGHNLDGRTVEENRVEPTCSEDGGYDLVLYCTKCGQEISRIHKTLPATGHKPASAVKENEKAATCTEDGGYDMVVYCSVCKEKLSSEHTVILALGHNYGEWKYDGEEVKTHTHVCANNSNHKETEPCTFDEGITVDGVTTYTCKVCGGTYTVKEEGPVKPVVSGITRVYGSNRFGTSFAISEAILKNAGKDKHDTVILANGDNFADALAGSYLAAVKGAPIIITRAAKVSEVNAYIKSVLNKGGTIYVLGGTAAVPESSLAGLSGYNIKRLAGNNRYGTNLEILKAAGIQGDTILIATGINYADSLSASATGLPMLLVKGQDSLNDDQIKFLKANPNKKLIILGGESAVSSNFEKELRKYGEVSRIAGDNRFATSIKIAEYFFPNATTAVLAYGSDFPDGLCGGPLAYQVGAPLILTRNDKTDIARPYTKERNITDGYALGGTSVLPDATVRKLFGASDSVKINEIKK